MERKSKTISRVINMYKYNYDCYSNSDYINNRKKENIYDKERIL